MSERERAEHVTPSDEDRCEECGSRRLFPDLRTRYLVCDDCGLEQLRGPIYAAEGKTEPSKTAPKHETRDASGKPLSPEQQRAANARETTEKFTKPPEERQSDRIRNVVKTLSGVELTEDEEDRVVELAMSTRSKDGRPLILRATGAAYYTLMEKHGFVRSENELVWRAGSKKLLSAAYESFVKLTGRRPESASAGSLIDYVVGALHLRTFTGTLAKDMIRGLSKEQGFPQYHLKDTRRSVANAVWDATRESLDEGRATKKEMETVLGLRIAPVKRKQQYRDDECNPFAFGMWNYPTVVQSCSEGERNLPGKARWFPGNRDVGLCNVHAEMFVRDNVKVPRFARNRRGVRHRARWTDFAGAAGLFMLRKPREDWSGGSRRNRVRARDEHKRLLVHITALPPRPSWKRVQIKSGKAVVVEDEERRQEHRLFVMETPGKEALERAEANPRRVFWCPRCGTEIAMDRSGNAGDDRVMTEFRKADHPGSRRRPIYIGEPRPSPSWHEFRPARNRADSLQGHVVYDLEQEQWVIHALYWKIGTDNPDDKRWRWCVNCRRYIPKGAVSRPRKGSRLIDRTPWFSP